MVYIEVDHSDGLRSNLKIKLKYHLVCTELMIRVFVQFPTLLSRPTLEEGKSVAPKSVV
jgi:hypothetical protein